LIQLKTHSFFLSQQKQDKIVAPKAEKELSLEHGMGRSQKMLIEPVFLNV
jgi:hypothetical protein